MSVTANDIPAEISKIGSPPNGKQLTPEEIFLKYSHLRIDETTDIPRPVPVLMIGGEIISTEGNITAIAGPPKGGKSAFCYGVIAGAIAKGDYDGFVDVEVSLNSAGRAVIHIDTEQSRYKHQLNVKTILKRCNIAKSPAFFLSYNIRALKLEEYKKVTLEIIDAAHKTYKGIHLLVIDGIADYIADVNDTQVSNEIVKFFEELAINYSTPIITVIHLNPNSEKERGNLGSQIQRKAESVLHIKTAEDISTLEPKFLRMAGKGKIPQIQFRYSQAKGYHDYVGVKPQDQEAQFIKDGKRIKAIELVCDQVFDSLSGYAYQDAIEIIMKKANRQERASKDIFKEMNVHEMIIQGSDTLWRRNRKTSET